MVAVIHAAERGQHIIDSLPTQQGRRTIPSTRPDGGCEVLLRFSHGNAVEYSMQTVIVCLNVCLNWR